MRPSSDKPSVRIKYKCQKLVGGKLPPFTNHDVGWVQGTVTASTRQTWTRIELHENRGLTVWERLE